ncbi:hypothetical protein DU472_03310 [Campylobacter novaezeelandiae]|uniref:Lipoprotein n=1 Tax=Campylobacter novaezeelandiae TaxID=2267891 RepID=A0A4Q9JTP6_9BACT|nr:hypothetical protein DU473_06305 [Campylobacter novaezeelandiae]TBR81354.1 hypothetical protein DU472_03310 [Campylobacter novaezeelandiae]
MKAYHIIYNSINTFNFLHKIILAFFFLIFLSACGYKDNPSYISYDQNKSVKSIKKYENLNRW